MRVRARRSRQHGDTTTLFNMKKITIFILSIILYSCNFSDKAEKLPFGYEVLYEGGNQNRLLKNNDLVIDSGLVDCKFKKNYLLISVDTTYSITPDKINKKNLKYFVQNIKQDSTIKNVSYNNIQKVIKEKSLEDIDITK